MDTYTISFRFFIINEKDFVLYKFHTEAKEKVDNIKKQSHVPRY